MGNDTSEGASLCIDRAESISDDVAEPAAPADAAAAATVACRESEV